MRGIVLPENLIMRENENQRLIPEVYGAALEREDAAWTSSDERILKVDKDVYKRQEVSRTGSPPWH